MSAQQKTNHGFWFTPYLPVLGFVSGLGLWAIDTAIDVFLLHAEESFVEALWPHELTKLWMRSLIVIVFTAGGYLGQFLVSRMEKLATDLIEHKAHLEELISARTQELENKNQELEQLAVTDPLTGLYNRRRFTEFIEYEQDRYNRTQTPISLLMLDIDHFKHINDSYGHDVGDQVLVILTELLKSSLRKTDMIARWGGEEFMVLLPGTPLTGAMKIAEKLRALCAAHVYEIGQPVTVSIGAIEFKEKLSEQELLKKVDDALYHAKEKGRNRVEAA